MVGVVEIKKPGDILTKPTVLGELKVWKLFYPEFRTTRVEMWSGLSALVMRHFAALQTVESRRDILGCIRQVLQEKFQARQVVHHHGCLRNIGYGIENGRPIPVVFDLSSVREYVVETDSDWVDRAMRTLIDSLFMTRCRLMGLLCVNIDNDCFEM